MQTHGGADAEAAILAPERTMRAEVTVDWSRNNQYNHFLSDLSPFADNITTDRSLSGAAPAEIMLVEGSAAAELSFEIGGSLAPGLYNGLSYWEPVNLVGIFSPYNGVSPIYNIDPMGCEITYRLGVDTYFGTVWYDQFIGNVRTITPNRQDNKVIITALDRVEKLRRPIMHTDWGILDLQANQGRVLGQLMNAHWVIDHCLKSCDISPSPYRWFYDKEVDSADGVFVDSMTQIYVSGNGGVAPNIGWVDGSQHNQFPNTEAVPARTMYQELGEAHPNSHSTARPQGFRSHRDEGSDQTIYWSADREKVLHAFTHLLTFNLYTGSQWFLTMPDAPIMTLNMKNSRQVAVWVGAGKMWLRYIDTQTGGAWVTTKITIPTAQTYVKCTAKFQYGAAPGTSGERMRLQVGASIGSWTPTQNYHGFLMDTAVGVLYVWRELAFQDLAYISYDYVNNTTDEALHEAEYAAVLDRSFNRLSFLPNKRGSLAWDVITEVAAAEFGAVFWDEEGIFHFWNQDTILAKKDVFVRDFNLDDVSGLEITNSTDSIRNALSIKAKKARVQAVRVFETTGPDELYLEPGVTTVYQIWVDDIVTPNSGKPPTYKAEGVVSSLPEWSESVNIGMLTQRFIGGVWEQMEVSSPWEGYMYRKGDGSTIVELWNGFAEPVRFADPNGGPAFRWDGSKLTKFDDQNFTVENRDSQARWGVQGITFESDWYQEFFDYGSFFTKLLTRTSKPIPTTQNIVVAGDPRIQLGDSIRVFDPEGLGENVRLQILGINRTFSRDGGLVDSYTVEMTEPPRIGIWDSAQYGLWNTSFIWS